jgi:hypothetical protein
MENGITEEIKKRIDNMPYETMLSRWRFAPVGDPMFQGETGDYYLKVMSAKRELVGHNAHVQASKNIGWE